MQLATISQPSSSLDFWSDAVLSQPYAAYRELRELGGVVWLERHGVWAITRFQEVREALHDGKTFSSAHGCMMNEATNQAMRGTLLCSDNPEHLRLRSVYARPLTPSAIAPLQDRVRQLTVAHVDGLLARDQFDAVTELAHHLPLSVVTDLVGLDEQGKAKVLFWTMGILNAFGSDTHPRTRAGMEITGEAVAYLQGLTRDGLAPQGWGAALFRAADEGAISEQTAKAMLMDYMGPSIGTTINGLSSAIWLFANNSTQWDLLRRRPELVDAAINEVLRIESPIRAFSRELARDCDFGGVRLAASSRALMLYGCANRDERRYADPDRFDITRDAHDHLAFGYGTHGCPGAHLAKLEMRTVLNVLAERVAGFDIVEDSWELNNTLRGLSRLVVRARR